MIIRPIHDISGNMLLSYDSSIYQHLLGTGISLCLCMLETDILRIEVKHCKNQKYYTFSIFTSLCPR